MAEKVEKAEKEEIVADLSNPDVTTKYRSASDIVNKALQAVADKAAAGVTIQELCELSDKLIEEECGKLFNKKVKDPKDASADAKKIDKGIAFPTCISINNICGHVSPTKSDQIPALQDGDLVKIDLGVHFDGFVAQGAHTIVIGSETVQGRKADVIRAAWTAAEAAQRAAQLGASNKDITTVIQKAAEAFKCNPLQGVLSHQTKKWVIDGNKVIMNHQGDDQVDDINLELHEVYILDLVISTGDGKPRESEVRSTVFKRASDHQYSLKTQKARQFISEVNHRFPTLPFTLRAFEDEQIGRIGVSEAKRHDLLNEYPVLQEREGEYVAQFKFTLLMLPTGPKKISGLPFAQDKQILSDHKVEDEDLKKVLSVSMNPKTKKKKDAEKKENAPAEAEG